MNCDLDCAKPDYALPKDLQDKITEHGNLCDWLKKLYATKNADYGDSMHPLFEEYGLTAFLVLFGIKIQRIKSLQNKESDRNYESLEDSLLDLANYALIAVTELRAKNKSESNCCRPEYALDYNRPYDRMKGDSNEHKV